MFLCLGNDILFAEAIQLPCFIAIKTVQQNIPQNASQIDMRGGHFINLTDLDARQR